MTPRRGPRLGRPQDPAGFTLVEILLAIFIFAMVISLLFTSHRTLMQQNQDLEEGEAMVKMASSCLNRITADLNGFQASLPPRYAIPEFGASDDPLRVTCVVENKGGADVSRLSFASTAHLPLDGAGRQGVAQIVYYVQPDPVHHAVLRRADRIAAGDPLAENPLDPVLCRQVRGFRVSLLDGDGRSHDHWDSESDLFMYQTPRAVAIELVVEGGGRNHRFATMVALPVFREKVEDR